MKLAANIHTFIYISKKKKNEFSKIILLFNYNTVILHKQLSNILYYI